MPVLKAQLRNVSGLYDSSPFIYNVGIEESVESRQQFGWQMDFPVSNPDVTLDCDYFVMELVTNI